MSQNEVISTETLIVGAGLIGSATAMHLAELGMTGIRVVDFDLEGTLSSSELNAGGVRATFVQPVNIEMSKLTIEYLEAHAQEVGYRACGYLWLHTPDKLPAALAARERQAARGWDVQVWDVPELRRRVEILDKTDDLAGALFAPRDGLVNPNLLKTHFRARARKLGVVFDDRTLVRSSEYSPAGVSVRGERARRLASDDEKVEILEGRKPAALELEPVSYRAQRVINCAGAWAGEVARALGYASPVHPMRRQISIFDCREADLSRYGMIVDTSGVYFHPEATNGLAGFADLSEAHRINYRYDGEEFFMEKLWPALYERSSAFEKLKHLTGWAGQYEISPDECAIIGRLEDASEAGRSHRVFESHSYSGHGVMHAHAAGLALAELIVRGRYETIDATPLSGGRFAAGREIRETAVI
jgi:glycine/D-amino acid oxidase-like deaminating enzyme